jgi:alpha-1,3-mannosylglycoprotein beta-1,4-N-acetylglucosaminyltransferase A/B
LSSTERKFYPNFENLPPDRIFGDDKKRVKWRTKQNYDVSYLMAYCHTKGQYYLQLEDDIASKPGFIAVIKDFMAKQQYAYWYSLEFCDLGFIGKLFHSTDLVQLVNYFLMFADFMPIDILNMLFQVVQFCLF